MSAHLPLAIVPSLCSLLYLLIFFLVLRKCALKASTTRLLLAYLGLLIAAGILLALGNLRLLASAFNSRYPLYGIALLSLTFAFLTQALLRSGKLGLPWIIGGIVWIAGYTILDANLLNLPENVIKGQSWVITLQSISTTLLITGWAAFMGKAVLLSLKATRGKVPPLIKNRANYWNLALGILIAGDILSFFSLDTPACALRLPAVLLAATVVIRPYMPDIRQMERQAIKYLVMTILTGIVLLIGLFIAAPLIESAEEYNPTLVGAGLSLFLAAMLTPLWLASERVVERLVPRRDLQTNRVLREYSQSVSSILDPELLTTVAIGLISEAIQIESGHLFLVEFEVDEGVSRYRLHGSRGIGDEPPESGLLSAKGVLAEYFLKERRYLFQSDIQLEERFQNIAQEELSWLERLGADVYVPIYTKEDWMGLIVLGPKLSGLPYFEDDLILLSILADQTAVALQNAHMVESLMRLNNDFRRAYSAMEQANRHLQTVNTQLENLDRTKSDFISIASHELRTPLTVMRGYNEMLLEDPVVTGNPFHAKLVKGIYSGIMRLHEIISSMLDMANIDTRALELKTEPVSLIALIKLITDGLRESCKERNLTLEIENLSDLPKINADIEALRKVFYQLIVNAIKYTPDGGKITITGLNVSAGQMDMAEGGVEIIVSDTGIGINPEYADLIFTKFYQTGEVALHSTGRTKFKGSGPGLGLAIARGIVEAHRGKIWVESSGHDEATCPGSQFHVVLPLHYQEQS
ncbi:MAG: HAMP domain-containing histidine kinase [Anaerolineales bacterium]|nr:HAMP domain-containing histidine kinase [Anaerolineales bacterium]